MEPILLIDDDRELGELVTEFLSGAGFEVEIATDGKQGLKRALSGEHMLVILDVMLPSLGGFDLLQKLRASSNIPVIMLTARGEEIDRILGLEMGADDYLPKPFNPRELVARLRAVSRRLHDVQPHEYGQQGNVIAVDDITLDPLERVVTCKKQALLVTDAEFSLLHELLKHAGEVIKREDLIEKVLGRHPSVFDRSIDVHISSLRKKVGAKYQGRQRFRAVRGVGYMYTAGRNGK